MKAIGYRAQDAESDSLILSPRYEAESLVHEMLVLDAEELSPHLLFDRNFLER